MKKLIGEMVRFGVVGVFNTILGLVLTFTFYNALHWNYWVASGVSYTIGSVLSYFLNKKLTFRVEGHEAKYVIRFAINIIICYLISYGLARPLVRIVLEGYDVKIVENVAMLVGMGLFVVVNFVGQKLLVFTEDKKETPQS